VVASLARRLIDEWDSWFEDPEVFFSGDSGMVLFVERLKNQPGGVAIRQAMNASPALRQMDSDDNQRIAEHFSAALKRRVPGVDYDEAVFTILVSIESSLAVIDRTFDLPPAEAERMISVCIEMQDQFLASRIPVLGRRSG
jgi:hypothetical protein